MRTSATRLRTSSSTAPTARFRLSDHRGERVVLLFYPGTTRRSARASSAPTATAPTSFDSLGATVVGISSQSVDSHEAFTAEHGLNVPLLADEDG